MLSDCITKNFAGYYATPQAADGFQRIYENIDGYQDRFAKFWNVTSKFFSNNSYIVGYDMINEPLAANMVTQPYTAVPGVNDLIHLQPLYQRINSVIRENDEEKILFFEPIQGDLLPVLGGMVFPIGFNETPGGELYNDRQVLNDHSYCCQAGAEICKTGEPTSNDTELCSNFNFARVTTRAIDAKILNVGLMITEFGACFDTDICVNEITSVTNACDYNMVGWAYWMFKGYGDFTTSGNLEEGFYNDQTLQVAKVAALARTYVQYYQGTPTSIFYNSTNGYFQTSFMLDPTVTNTTHLFYSSEFNYPTGVKLDIISSNPNVVCEPANTSHNYYDIQCSPLQSSNITIILTSS